MPILDIQKRARELGRIRIGQVVPTSNGKTRPEKLDRFRLTSASKPLLDKVAELYGGEVAEWQPQGGGAKAWEVVTTSTRLPIMVPPQPVTQWYEYWTRAGCAHRCDGQTNWQTGEPCDLESDEHLEAIKRPTTRLNVVLRDVEGIGVWRLETHGWNAAVELPDAAHFLASAGGYVNGWVSLEERVSVSEGKTRRFMVPIIEIDVTPAELMAGKGRIVPPALEGPVPATPALEGGADPYVGFFARVESATSFETCQEIWADAVAAQLVGVASTDSPRRTEFIEALKVKGSALQAAAAPAQPAAQEAEPDEDGAFEAEVVDDAPAAGGDEDVIWNRILKAGGERSMGLSEVTEDFKARMGGLLPDDASGAELQAYLDMLTGTGAAA